MYIWTINLYSIEKNKSLISVNGDKNLILIFILLQVILTVMNTQVFTVT